MWEAIGGAIKELAEKHLIPFVIAVVSAIGVLLYLPVDCWMIEKVGKSMFFVFVSGIVFLAVKFIILCGKRIGRWVNGRNEKNKKGATDDQVEKKIISDFWEDVDALSPSDRQLLKDFLESENKPIEYPDGRFHRTNSLLDSDWVISTEVYGEPTEADVIGIPPQLRESLTKEDLMKMVRPIHKQYKLKEKVYDLLKYSMKKYGRISNFE